MRIDLRCPVCRGHFGAEAATPSEDILDRMSEEGPWYALAEGASFEDMVQAAVAERGKILCPDCHTAVAIAGLRRGWRQRTLAMCG